MTSSSMGLMSLNIRYDDIEAILGYDQFINEHLFSKYTLHTLFHTLNHFKISIYLKSKQMCVTVSR